MLISYEIVDIYLIIVYILINGGTLAVPLFQKYLKGIYANNSIKLAKTNKIIRIEAF